MGEICALAERLVQLDDDIHGLHLKVRHQIDSAADPRLPDWVDARLADIVALVNHTASRAVALANYELMELADTNPKALADAFAAEHPTWGQRRLWQEWNKAPGNPHIPRNMFRKERTTRKRRAG
jgi:hypothetical protein